MSKELPALPVQERITTAFSHRRCPRFRRRFSVRRHHSVGQSLVV